MKSVKCLLVGDRKAEKADLLISYMTILSPEHVLTVSEHFETTVTIGQEAYQLCLSDYQDYRDTFEPPARFPKTDVVIVCFSVVCPYSFENVKEQWVPVILYNYPDAPFLLVGTHMDLREDQETVEKLARNKLCPVKPERSKKMARKVGAVKYLECSARTQEGVKKVFDEAILATLEPRKTKKQKMCVL